jgi:5-(carboxyamino)imidazole ribonucleotide synthase
MDQAPLEPLAPGAVIGILGGGQLGRMAALAAAPLGYRCHIFCPEPEAPALQVTDLATVASYHDQTALTAFAQDVDVVTFEFENIPFQAVEFLAERVPVRPRPEILRICQNRLREKDFCRSIGVPTAAYAAIRGPEDLDRAVSRVGRPCILKTAEMGYDGKGQVAINAGDDLAQAWHTTAGAATEAGAIAEAFVDFRLEISVLVARAADGTCRTYDPVENVHRNHILHQTIVPAPIAPETTECALEIARRLAQDLDLVGLFSQFEQFIRAVAGLPLGTTTRLADAVMTNLLGAEAEGWREILAEPDAKLHLYGKQEPRPGRKMGHVTRVMPKARNDV